MGSVGNYYIGIGRWLTYLGQALVLGVAVGIRALATPLSLGNRLVLHRLNMWVTALLLLWAIATTSCREIVQRLVVPSPFLHGE